MKQTEKKKITGVVVFTVTVTITNLESKIKYTHSLRVGGCVEDVDRENIYSAQKRHGNNIYKIYRSEYPEDKYSLKVRVSSRVMECDMVC